MPLPVLVGEATTGCLDGVGGLVVRVAEAEVFTLVGDELGAAPLEVADGVADVDGEDVGVWVGLWLGEPDSQLGDGDGASLAGSDGEAEPEGSAVALESPLGVLDAPVLGESVGPVEGEPSVGVGDPVQGAPDAVASIAKPGFAGMTSRAPIATVPVATTPTTDAADRPRRTCFGTVITPSYRLAAEHSDQAPRWAHRPP